MQNKCSKRQYQTCKCNSAECKGDQAKTEDDLIFAPSAAFEVVMDGRHLEQTLAMSEFEIANLQNNREALTNVDNAYEEQEKGVTDEHRQCHYHTAQEH